MLPLKLKEDMKVQLIYQTYKGTLCHLTPFNQSLSLISRVLLTVSDIHDFHLEEYSLATGRPSLDLFCLSQYTVYLSNLKAHSNLLINHAPPSSLKLKLNNGFAIYDNPTYLNIIHSLLPQKLIGLTEDPSSFSSPSSKKQVARASSKNTSLIKQLLSQESNLKSDLLISLVDYTHPLIFQEQVKKVKEIQGLKGILLTGYNNGQLINSDHTIHLERLRQSISIINQQLGQQDEIILLSGGSLLEILIGILNGVSSFTTEYPFILAKQGIMLDLHMNFPFSSQSNSNSNSNHNDDIENLFSKKERQRDLNEKIYQDDSNSLNDECECHSCKNHMRMYLYHLLDNKEMNAQILLTIHNCYQMNSLIERINNSQNQLEYVKEFMRVNLI